MAARDNTPPPFPRLPLIGAGIAVFGSLAYATYGSMMGWAKPEMPTGPAFVERDLRFSDRPDGAVVVSIAQTGQVIEVVTGEAGFFRGMLRGFARQRRLDGVGETPPLHLAEYPDGRLILSDSQTGRVIDLEAFGSRNKPVFEDLLTAPPMGPIIGVGTPAEAGAKPAAQDSRGI